MNEDPDLFAGRGVLLIRSAFGAGEAAYLREALWRHIESTTPVRLSDQATWGYEGNFGLGPVERRESWSLVTSSPGVVQALDTLLGADQWARDDNVDVLLTFPTTNEWRMPSGWHLDGGFRIPTWPTFAIKLFALLDDLEPCGGGTLLLEGSHRLVEAVTKDAAFDESELSTVDPQLRTLFNGGGGRAALGRPFNACNVEVTPIEITGTAGDVVLTHMQVMHAPSMNACASPRQMIGSAFRRHVGSS